MIAENREQMEKRNDYEKCIQALESYLRQEASYDAISNEHMAEAFERRLALKAKDWNLKYKADMSENDFMAIAEEAIRRYMKNWEDKKQGEDDRAHRLGKSHYLGT